MIKRGLAYADDTPQARMREERMSGTTSARRNATVEETLTHFSEIVKGTEEGLRYVYPYILFSSIP